MREMVTVGLLWLIFGIHAVPSRAYEPGLLAYNCDACGDTTCDEAGCDSLPLRKGKADWACAPAIKGLNYANDFSYLDDPENEINCFGDSLKRLYKNGDRWVDIGGSFRLRFHDEQRLGRQPGTQLLDEGRSNPLLTQFRPYANLQLNDSVRVFVEGLYADVIAENDGYRPRGNERNRGDFLNLFADIDLTDQTSLRIGRQQIRYGSRRLLAGPGWANTSRNHDGAKLIFKSDSRQIDAFYLQTVAVELNRIDDISDDRRLFGIWSSSKADDSVTDIYYVGFQDQRIGRERVLHNVGGRIKSSTDLCSGLLYEIEGIGQFGRQRTQGRDHLAAMFVAGVGKEFKQLPWNPTLWCYYDLATGEDGGQKSNRYDRIFDRAHWLLGFIDTVQRSNVEVISLIGTLSPSDRLDVIGRYYRVYAHREQDVIRGVQQAFADQRLDSDDYGDVVDFATKWKVAPRSDFRIGYSYFWPGSKIVSNNTAAFTYLEWNVWF